MSKKTKPAPTKEKAPSFSAASGTIEIDGEVFEVKGHATLPMFKIDSGKAVVVLIDGEIAVKEKRDKDGPVLDQRGNPATISVVKVVMVKTGEVGQIVCGAVLARALKDYPGGYVGKKFALLKGNAPEGKAKPWTVTEVA